MKPLISIITPCFNSKNTLEECILSIRNQNNENIEHIIIDGGSKDGTLEIIKKYEGTYNLKWISEKDNGIADAMNKGFRMASGTYCAWIDADNYYDLNIFEKIITKIKSNPEIDIIYGDVDMVENGKIIKKYKPYNPINFKSALLYNTSGIPIQPGNFFKLELFKKVEGFNTKYRIAGDVEFWFKVLKTQPTTYYLEEIFGYYRKEESGASQSLKGIMKGLKEMLEIGSEYKQTFLGKLFLIKKYTRGYLSVCKQNLIKKIKHVK